MEWQTKKLSGSLRIMKRNGWYVYGTLFDIPACEAVGSNAKVNVTRAARLDGAKKRCVSHYYSWGIKNAQIAPYEHMVFRYDAAPDIDYWISLSPDHDDEPRFCQSEDSDLCNTLDELLCHPSRALTLRDCQSSEQLINVVGAAVELRYLTLKSCWHGKSVFPSIGCLEHLRGLELDQWYRKERGHIVFDRAAVTELGKLENFEVLALRNGITITDDALAELGALKNLKALYLNLSSHEFADKSACVEALSFLKKLDKLEYLNITTRHPNSRDRLTLRALEFPPNLKYLVLEGRVYHPNTTRFEKDKREKANGSETPAAILLKYGLPKFDNTRNSFVIGFKSPPLHTATVKPLVKLSVEEGALIGRFKGEEAFRIAGDGATPESRRQLVAALREMLLKLPPKDGAKIVEHGIAVDFDAPELAKLIETELAIKVLSKTQNK